MKKILLLPLLLLPLGGLNAADAVKSSARPNIIVILADDQGYADLGVQGQVKDIRTPHLDALAAGGVRCTSGYDTAPQCSPSRAGLITGRYQQKFGLDTIPDDPMPLAEVTIPERLKKAGYVSGMVGKWHLAPNALSLKWARTNLPSAKPNAEGRIKIPIKEMRRYSSLAQGFDECFEGEMGHYFATFGLAGQTLNSKGKELDEPAFRLDVQTDAALAFLRRHHGQDRKPFFLYLAYFGPHVPLEAPTNYLSRFPGPMAERRRYALAMLSAIDDGVGRITAALKQYGVSDNTLIFYTSDNGAPLGAAQPGGPMTDVLPVDEPGAAWDGSMNVPWLGEKGMLAEGGMHVPFIMNWPSQLPAGKVYEQPVSTLDIASTAVALAGLPHDDRLDGVNLLPFLTGKDNAAPHDALYWRFWDQAAVRAGQWKYIQAGTTAKYLFDVTSDEHEKKNLINQHPEIAKSLAEKLSDWTRQLAPPGDPARPLNIAEQRLYQYYFGLPEEPSAPANMKPEPGSIAEEQAQALNFTPDPKLPNVLILGDSISIGYTLDVRKLLAGKANVYRAMTANGKRVDNCGDTQRGLKFIDKWLGDTKWDVIYFNWGLHDLKRVSAEKGMQSYDPSVPPMDSIEVYAENLTKLIARLKQTGASLIFATTTPYPAGVKPCRIPEDAERYNQAALAVMKKNGVRVNDLYSAVLPRLAELQLATNVHFKPEGSTFLAQKVAASIVSALERR